MPTATRCNNNKYNTRRLLFLPRKSKSRRQIYMLRFYEEPVRYPVVNVCKWSRFSKEIY